MHLRPHIDRALLVLAREVPALCVQLAELLGPQAVCLVNGAEVFDVVAHRGVLSTRGSQPTGLPRVQLSPRWVFELLQGRDDLLGGLGSGQLEVFADLEQLLALEEALRMFVNAAVRAPGMVHVLSAFVREWEYEHVERV